MDPEGYPEVILNLWIAGKGTGPMAGGLSLVGRAERGEWTVEGAAALW